MCRAIVHNIPVSSLEPVWPQQVQRAGSDSWTTTRCGEILQLEDFSKTTIAKEEDRTSVKFWGKVPTAKISGDYEQPRQIQESVEILQLGW